MNKLREVVTILREIIAARDEIELQAKERLVDIEAGVLCVPSSAPFVRWMRAEEKAKQWLKENPCEPV